MAKSILKIDVDDSAFKRFEAEYNRWQKAKTAAGAGLVSQKDMKEAEASMKRQMAVLSSKGEATRKTAAIEIAGAAAVQRAARAWETISTNSKKTASHVYDMTSKMLKWAGVSAAVGSLVGIGGSLWGIDRLAASAGAARRSSGGLGMSYGEQQAFGLTYGRLVDSGSFLGGVSQAKGNIASPAAAAIYALGLDPTKGSGLAGSALDRVRGLVQNTPEHLLGTLLQSHNLGELGLGVEDLRRIKGTSNKEYDQFRGEYTKRRGDLNVGDPALKAGQDLAIQLDVAAGKIKSVLIEGLTDLAPQLSRISEAFSDVVKKLLGSQGVKDALKWVAGGLKEFGDYIQGPDFKKDVKDFVAGISALAGAVAKGLRLLGLLPDSSSTGAGSAMTYEDFRNRILNNPKNKGKEPNEPWLRDQYKQYLQQQGLYSPAGAYGPGIAAGDAGQLGNFMRAVANVETGGHKDPYGALGPADKFGNKAHGKYQIMGSNIGPWSKEALGRELTREEFLRSPEAQEAIAKHKMAQYFQKFGNWDDVASAWHSGVPLSEARRQGRRDVNMSTTSYVEKVNQNRVVVQVENNTGGSAITQINQIAY